MRIAVIDGQGGGIGARLVEKIRKAMPEGTEVWALGTNAHATSAMMKAGANMGGTGENAICHSCFEVDVIVGTLSILLANSMMGEVTARMVKAVGESKAKKYLLPLNRSGVWVAGTPDEPLPHLIDMLVAQIQKMGA